MTASKVPSRQDSTKTYDHTRRLLVFLSLIVGFAFDPHTHTHARARTHARTHHPLQGGRLSQIRIRRSLERVNEDIEEERMTTLCTEEVADLHRWLVTWFRGEFPNKDTELTTFKTRFHPRYAPRLPRTHRFPSMHSLFCT